MNTIKKLREGTTRAAVHAAGQIRKMVITLSSKALWQATGFTMLDGKPEVLPVEPFGGIGFYARPPTSGKPEAIVLMGGSDSKWPVAVAVRDEKTRQAIAGALATNETAMFNSLVIAVAKAIGEFHIRSKNGTAEPLATKADIDALANWIHSTMIVNASGATAGTTTAPPSAAGTTVLKAE